MKLSVVIPVYNEEKLLGQCLTALSKQTVMPDEIIVVDNNCRDRSMEIARQYHARIVPEKKQGISYARNAGFDAARFEIIGRIDADTVVAPNWVEEIKKGFTGPKVAAVGGPAMFRGFLFSRLTEYFHTLIYYHFLSVIHGHYMLYGSNMALTKKAWLEVKDHVIMDNKLVHEDLDISIHLAKVGQIRYLPQARVTVSNRRILNIPSALEYLGRYLGMVKRLYVTKNYFR